MSAVLLHNALEMMSSFTDASCLRDFLPCLAAYRVSKKHSLLLFKQTMDGLYLPIIHYCCCHFIHQPLQTSSAPHLLLKFPQQSSRAKSGLLTFESWHQCVIIFMRLELTDVFRTKLRWSPPKIMQTGSDVLNMWAVKRSWPQLLAHPVHSVFVYMGFFSAVGPGPPKKPLGIITLHVIRSWSTTWL